MNQQCEPLNNDTRPHSLTRIAMILSVFVLIVGFLLLAPVKQWLIDILAAIQQLGTAAPAIVSLFYVVAAVAFLPGSVLTLGAGFLFGVKVGFVTVWIGATAGACAAFLIGRNLARDWVTGKVSSHPKFSALDDAIAREGFKLILLLRLSPIFPYNFLNYALGLTKVTFRSFALASGLGMIPGALMYVYIGSAARSLAEVASGNLHTGFAGQFFFWVGLLATILVAVLATRIATRSIKQVQQTPGDK